MPAVESQQLQLPTMPLRACLQHVRGAHQALFCQGQMPGGRMAGQGPGGRAPGGVQGHTEADRKLTAGVKDNCTMLILYMIVW